MGKEKGLLLVVSGPSGAGKGTICNLLRQRLPELAYSVSVTTRAPRAGEVDGKDYFFKTVEQVKDMIFKGELLEHAKVYDNYYGTPKPYVMNLLAEGRDVLLEIDIQGALQVKKMYPEGVFVFIVPPSFAELRARIEKRGTDSTEAIALRMAETAKELGKSSQYDYIIVNDVAEDAASRIITILEAERYQAFRQAELVNGIIKEARAYK